MESTFPSWIPKRSCRAMAKGDYKYFRRKKMTPFLDLQSINAQYRAELIEACTRVIDSGW